MTFDDSVIFLYMKYEFRNNLAVGEEGKNGNELNTLDDRFKKTTICL